MSIVKRELEQREELSDLALGVLTEAGVLEECEDHPGVYLDSGEDIEEAYRLANSKITSGNIVLPTGHSRRDFTDIIKNAYSNNCADECNSCLKWQDD